MNPGWSHARGPRAAHDSALKSLSGGHRSASVLERPRDPLRTFRPRHRIPDAQTQALRIQPVGWKSSARAGNLYAASNLELVPGKRHRTDRHPPGQGLLSRARSAVRDRTGGAVEDWTVREETRQMRVCRYVELSRVSGGQRRHHVDVLRGERIQRGGDQAPIVLELG